MPGIHLNNIEEKLAKRWDCAGMSANTLKGISIQGGDVQPHAELRGISSLDIDFKYPVTVLCGKNGTGKTTILSLAALGFHGAEGFFPRGMALRSYHRGHYTFSDFFYKGPQDSDCKGISIEWRYCNIPSVKIRKRSEKWMHYERRPSKATQFLGPIRIASAMEQRVLRSHFKNAQKVATQPLDDEYLGYLSEILGRPYNLAEDLFHKGYHLRVCRARRGTYSSFNMGAGEDAIIDLLSCIQSMPKESLCVIEEIELGIYPEALARLAQVIQRIAFKKKMQFIISSHSQFFIDQLPRRARILLQRYEDTCSPIYEPTTRYAIGNMSQDYSPELMIYCEDRLAGQILLLAVSNLVRQRIVTIPVGSKSEFKKVYDWHQTSTPRMKCLFVWDGDVKDSEVRKIFSNVDKFNYFFLHEKETPERNLISKLLENGLDEFTKMFGFINSRSSSELLQRLLALKNPHDFAYELSRETKLDEQMVVNKVIECYLSVCPNEKAQIERLIERCLSLGDGEYLEEHNRTMPATV